MEIYKITKGNFALENTRDIRPHENNLRFHIKIEEKYYEYAIDTINKKTINIRCVICKSKFKKNVMPVSFCGQTAEKVTAKYETLQDLCEAFDNFSEPERKLNLFKYLGLFSTRDAIPDQYYEDPDDLETVPQ